MNGPTMHGRVISTTRRAPSSERWQSAAQRALKKGIEVRHVNENGMWVANSGSQPGVAYVLEISQGIVHSCSCPAMALWGDSVCCHAARFYLDTGRVVLPALDDESDESAWLDANGAFGLHLAGDEDDVAGTAGEVGA